MAKVCFLNKLAFHLACYTIHMHIVFSIDTPFLAPQNSFRMKIMEMHMVESCVRGFHVYQDIWTPITGKCLSCQMEDSNAFDPYAVAIRKGANIIGHVPRKISAACSLFIQRGKGTPNKRLLNGRKVTEILMIIIIII